MLSVMEWQDLWPRAGRGIFMLAALTAAGLAYVEVLREVWKPGKALSETAAGQEELAKTVDSGEEIRTFGKWLRQGALAAIILALAQGIYLAVTLTLEGFSSASGIGCFYLICTAPVAFLWAAGRRHERWLGWPCKQAGWSAMRKVMIIAGIGAGGVGLNLALFALVQMKAGSAVRELSEESSVPAMGLMAFWLIINAPWIEELTFRHYIIPRLALGWGGGRWAVAGAIMVAATVFTAGHAGHTVPAWPKLVQVMTWGLALGWARVWLGSGYAIALHLLWNLSAPLVALVVSVEG